MEIEEYLRIVSLRKGKLKPTEFRLRSREKGLSLFALGESIEIERIVDAVRAAGKQGELAPALVKHQVISALGLVIVKTQGATPDQAVNEVHYEARLPWWRAMLLRLQGISVHDYVNEKVSGVLCNAARLPEH